jgi:hypothetical protein
LSPRDDPPPEEPTPPIEDAFDSDRVDDEAAAIAAGRIRSGGAKENEDGAAALESLGISVSAQDILEELGHEPATLAEFEAAHGRVRPSDGEP